MTQRCLLIALAALIATVIAAQQTGDLAKLSADAEAALRAWREGDPDLEAEVGKSARGLLEQRIQRAGEDAQKATIARLAVANAVFQIAKDSLDWLDTEATTLAEDFQISAVKMQNAQLEEDAALLDRNIQVFEADTDPGFQKVTAAMQKERTALRAVRESLAEDQKLLAVTRETSDRGITARQPGVARYAELMSGARQDRESLERESSLWLSYYQALPQAALAQGFKTIAPGTARDESARVPIILPGTLAATPSPAKASLVVPAAPSVRPDSSAALFPADASRWVGEWAYPVSNAVYRGDEPEVVDLIVREQDGQLTGTFYTRFKIPRGWKREPQLRLDFNGPLIATRGQKMGAVTSDGTRGNLELMPGAAANLIEVTFQLDASVPVKGLSKVRQGSFVLLRK